MKPKAPRRDEASLPRSIVLTLLCGWGAAMPLGPNEDPRPLFELMKGDVPRVAELWRAHEPYLLSEAQRLGIERPRRSEWERTTSPPLFFGEDCILALSTRPHLYRRGAARPPDGD